MAAGEYRRDWGRTRGGGDALYGVGFIGALVHYLHHAHGITYVTGVLKALVWPAYLAYQLLGR